ARNFCSACGYALPPLHPDRLHPDRLHPDCHGLRPSTSALSASSTSSSSSAPVSVMPGDDSACLEPPPLARRVTCFNPDARSSEECFKITVPCCYHEDHVEPPRTTLRSHGRAPSPPFVPPTRVSDRSSRRTIPEADLPEQRPVMSR